MGMGRIARTHRRVLRRLVFSPHPRFLAHPPRRPLRSHGRLHARHRLPLSGKHRPQRPPPHPPRRHSPPPHPLARTGFRRCEPLPLGRPTHRRRGKPILRPRRRSPLAGSPRRHLAGDEPPRPTHRLPARHRVDHGRNRLHLPLPEILQSPRPPRRSRHPPPALRPTPRKHLPPPLGRLLCVQSRHPHLLRRRSPFR